MAVMLSSETDGPEVCMVRIETTFTPVLPEKKVCHQPSCILQRLPNRVQ